MREHANVRITVPALMAGLGYYETRIPVRGFHWLDFFVNSDQDDFLSIVDRGWTATIQTLRNVPGAAVPANASSPFRL